MSPAREYHSGPQRTEWHQRTLGIRSPGCPHRSDSVRIGIYQNNFLGFSFICLWVLARQSITISVSYPRCISRFHRLTPNPRHKVDELGLPDFSAMIGSRVGIHSNKLSPPQNVLTVFHRKKLGYHSRLCGWHAQSTVFVNNLASFMLRPMTMSSHLCGVLKGVRGVIRTQPLTGLRRFEEGTVGPTTEQHHPMWNDASSAACQVHRIDCAAN